MSGPYGYPSTGTFPPGTNSYATAEGYGGVDEHGHHTTSEHYATGGADEYDNDGSEQYGDTASHQYAAPVAGAPYSSAGQPVQTLPFSGDEPVYRFWIPADGISRWIIQNNITAFLGRNARVIQGPGNGKNAVRAQVSVSASSTKIKSREYPDIGTPHIEK
jgi:hypothetical protein